jgi:hypothetical protein
MGSRRTPESSFIIAGGANPEEETKESESVIFYRGRPHHDRYREDFDDDDNDPNQGSFFVFPPRPSVCLPAIVIVFLSLCASHTHTRRDCNEYRNGGNFFVCVFLRR